MSFLKSLRKQKTQYEFSLLIVSGKDLTCITEGQAIVCILKRKDKSLQTKVSLLGSDRTATWNERLDFTAAMWSDKKGFETKPYTVCISTLQGQELYKADIDLATIAIPDGQNESILNVNMTPTKGSGAGSLRIVAWSCAESVPKDRRNYGSGKSTDLDEKFDDTRQSFAATESSPAPLPQISGLKTGTSEGGAGESAAGETPKGKKQRKISVIFGQVSAGANPRMDSDSDEESSNNKTVVLSEQETQQQAYKRERNRFASVDVTNMVEENGRRHDLDEATRAMARASLDAGRVARHTRITEEEEGEEEDEEGADAAQRAYRQRRDRGLERFLEGDDEAPPKHRLDDD